MGSRILLCFIYTNGCLVLQVSKIHLPVMSDASVSSPPESLELPTTLKREAVRTKAKKSLKKLPLKMKYLKREAILGTEVDSKLQLITNTSVGAWAEM